MSKQLIYKKILAKMIKPNKSKIFLSILLTSIISVSFAQNQVSAPVQDAKEPDWADTAYGYRLYEENKIGDNMYAVDLFEPNYIFPFYYTQTPDQGVYAGTTPENQRIKNIEIAGQLSFKVPVIRNVFTQDSNLDLAYTQAMFWQFYNESPYFRETDYTPEMFLEQHYGEHWVGRYGAVHESNGRGIPMERSWNRVYVQGIYSSRSWVLSIKPWTEVLQHESASLHNPDIEHYMGHGEISYAYKTQNEIVFSTMFRNNFESGFKRGAEEFNVSFPLHGHFKGYVRVFSGYGQSLIEYNHYTNAVAVGFVLNDWI